VHALRSQKLRNVPATDGYQAAHYKNLKRFSKMRVETVLAAKASQHFASGVRVAGSLFPEFHRSNRVAGPGDHRSNLAEGKQQI